MEESKNKLYGYTEIRKANMTLIRNLCVKHKFFTCGDNEEYAQLLNYSQKKNISTDDLVEMAQLIIEHSTEESLDGMEFVDVMYLINCYACAVIFVEDEN